MADRDRDDGRPDRGNARLRPSSPSGAGAGAGERDAHGIAGAESKVTVMNGSPGVSRLDVTVNGIVFKLTGLKSGEVRPTVEVVIADSYV